MGDAWNYPVDTLLRFFKAHGLLDIINRPQWYTIAGGSKQYIPAFTQRLKDNIYLNTKVLQLERDAQSVCLKTKDGEWLFDAAVIATHSDQALALLTSQPNKKHPYWVLFNIKRMRSSYIPIEKSCQSVNSLLLAGIITTQAKMNQH